MFAEPRGFPVVGIAVLARCTALSAVRGHCRGKIIKTARGATSAPCLRISEQCVVVCAAGRVLCILLNLNLFIDV